MLLLVALLALLLLPGPWNLVGFVAGLIAFVIEMLIWNRTVRHRRPRTGATTLLGLRGAVIAPCRPVGQVRVSGEIWGARCDGGADEGDEVVVTAVDGLTLVVERVA